MPKQGPRSLKKEQIQNVARTGGARDACTHQMGARPPIDCFTLFFDCFGSFFDCFEHFLIVFEVFWLFSWFACILIVLLCFWPPALRPAGPSRGYFDFGGFGPNLCSTKVAPRVSQGHRAAPRSPQEDRHFQTFLLSPGCPKSRPSWGLDLSTPCPFGGLGPNLCSTKIAPRASHGHRTSPRSPQEPQHFNKKNWKKIANRAPEPKLDFLDFNRSPWFPMVPYGSMIFQ